MPEGFEYLTEFKAEEPDCKLDFTREFVHTDWVDGQDVVQAQDTPEHVGFNTKFHQLEGDLDRLAAEVGRAFTCMAKMRFELRLLLDEIRSELRRSAKEKEGKEKEKDKEKEKEKDTKEGKEGKEQKDGKETKEGKDDKDQKDGKETKEKEKEREKRGKELAFKEKEDDRFSDIGPARPPFPLPQAPAVPPLVGRAFIRPEERPAVGSRLFRQEAR